jgi:tRNA pseudouridine55 synthase
VDGVLLLDKPAGVTSNGALQQARRLFNAAKAGHTGTLDPMATGLLPLCFGEATKFAGSLLDADKSYQATVLLGVSTDTADADGTVIERRPVCATQEEVQAVVARFVGDIEQIPPMYSALKRDGRPLYDYARAGIELEREARRVRIYAATLANWQGDRFDLAVTCSKGTYIRTLASDIGDALGCGAHLVALRRTAIGALDVADAIGFAALEDADMAMRDALLQPPDRLLSELPALELDAESSRRLLHGQSLQRAAPIQPRLRLYAPGGCFLGLGAQGDDGCLRSLRLLALDPQKIAASA